MSVLESQAKINWLKKLHEDLTSLQMGMGAFGVPNSIEPEKIRSIYDVQEIIEDLIRDEKGRIKIITGV